MTNNIFEMVSQRIEDGTVTTNDFNQLIEATDKSTRERVLRHARVTVPGTGQPSMAGRVVPKKHGRNDPPRQGRGRRYAAGTPAKERQNQKQRDNYAKSVAESIALIVRCHGTPVQSLLEGLRGVDTSILGPARALAAAFLRDKKARSLVESAASQKLDADWLFSFVGAVDGLLAESGVIAPSFSLLSEKRDKKEETRSYEVTGRAHQLDKLEQFFHWIQSCGSIGHSGTAELWVDGDGSARLKFSGLRKGLEPAEVDERSRGPEIKIGLD